MGPLFTDYTSSERVGASVPGRGRGGEEENLTLFCRYRFPVAEWCVFQMCLNFPTVFAFSDCVCGLHFRTAGNVTLTKFGD